MIIYATKETFDKYKLKRSEELKPPLDELVRTIIERETGDRLCEWGGKLFYFDRRKCIQIVNFASKFTLFLVDVKMKDLSNLGEYIAEYIFDIYSADKEMVSALGRMFKEHRYMCFSKLTDKSIISTLNSTQRIFADDGDLFYDYISNGILHTKDINRKVNCKWLFTTKTNNKTDYFYACEKFREVVLERYGGNTEGQA